MCEWREALVTLCFLIFILGVNTKTVHHGHNKVIDRPHQESRHLLPPRFGNTTNHVLTTVGTTTYLHCRVHHLGDKAVSWIRKKDLRILTVGPFTYTSDRRFHSLHDEGSDLWVLKLLDPEPSDAGVYECQVNTEPKKSLAFRISVIEAKAKILGPKEVYINAGSTLNLTCTLLRTPEPPSYIYWYQGDELINYSGRGGISVIIDKRTRTSYLLLNHATLRDSGNYTCAPSNAHPASANVHVLTNAEQSAAMQHGINAASHSAGLNICWTFMLLVYIVR